MVATSMRRSPAAGARVASVDRDLHAVDLVVILRNGPTEGAVAIDQRRERAPELLLDEAAHGEHLAANVLEILVETLGGVVREISGFHDAASLANGAPVGGALCATI
jgi:hypothetical protein